MYETTSLSILTSLIVMSAKYDFDDIRSEIVKHLKRYFTDNIADFDKEKETNLFLNPPSYYPIELLSVARSLDTPIILPSLFYLCAIQPLPTILTSSNILTWDDYEILINGREQMLKFMYEVGTATILNQTKKCTFAACLQKKVRLLVEHTQNSVHEPPSFPLNTLPRGMFGVLEGEHEDLCLSCANRYKAAHQNVRKEFWKFMPLIFKCGQWDVLRQLSDL